MTERIYIQVDDNELDALTSKLDTSMRRLRKIEKDTFKLDARTKSIITRLPGLREADMLWREIEAISTAAAGVEGAAGAVATGSAVLLLLMVTVSLLKRIERFERGIIRQQASYEDMVREGLDLTHEEWQELEREQRGYATAWEELMAGLKTDIPKAIENYLRVWWAQTFPGPYRGAAAGYGEKPGPFPGPAYPGAAAGYGERWDFDILEWLRNLVPEGQDTGYEYYWNLGDGPHE